MGGCGVFHPGGLSKRREADGGEQICHPTPHSCSVPSTSAMSLLYECVNTVIAGELQGVVFGGLAAPFPAWVRA